MKNNKSKGLGLGSVLTIVFVVLKLVNVIEWSWIWVLSPLWISLIISIICVISYAILKKTLDK